MKLYPESAATQLEFEKVKELLVHQCKTDFAIARAKNLRIHTKLDFIQLELDQSDEFKRIKNESINFPNDYVINIGKEIKLLSIPGSLLKEDQFMQIRKMTEMMERIFRWFDNEKREYFPALATIISNSYYERAIRDLIDEVLDDYGHIKDNATPELAEIRSELAKKRNELRRKFLRAIAKLQKAGYTADIDESFSNGRRVVAVFSEYKRQVKGILHGESDSRKTAFIEPEETIELNNIVYELESEEQREVTKILRDLTTNVSAYASILQNYHQILGMYDFIEAKAKLAIDMEASKPIVEDKALIHLIDAYHPLLLLYNRSAKKSTTPLTLELSDDNRILIISGPNAGGKTVSMKTIGLNQMMVQSGLLIPASSESKVGIFKQLFIHIGDTQSLEFELSTYSSHLLHMKHFIENANGRTLFFIDELGSGSDPNMGGAFAEVILEELLRRHSIGLVTTHYLNLKVMANSNKGILNAAMAFDEVHLKPLYKLLVGKPGSSYTFAIAERIGFPENLINRAKKMVSKEHFRLDQLLGTTEKELENVSKEKKQLHKLIRENESLKVETEQVLNKEKHNQKVEILKHQNKITEDRIQYLRDAERKMRQMVIDWRKTENKEDVINNIYQLLFPKNEKKTMQKLSKKIRSQYDEVPQEVVVGAKVIIRKSHQVATVEEIRGKRAIVKLGAIPMNVAIEDLTVVVEKETSDKD